MREWRAVSATISGEDTTVAIQAHRSSSVHASSYVGGTRIDTTYQMNDSAQTAFVFSRGYVRFDWPFTAGSRTDIVPNYAGVEQYPYRPSSDPYAYWTDESGPSGYIQSFYWQGFISMESWELITFTKP